MTVLDIASDFHDMCNKLEYRAYRHKRRRRRKTEAVAFVRFHSLATLQPGSTTIWSCLFDNMPTEGYYWSIRRMLVAGPAAGFSGAGFFVTAQQNFTFTGPSGEIPWADIVDRVVAPNVFADYGVNENIIQYNENLNVIIGSTNGAASQFLVTGLAEQYQDSAVAQGYGEA